MSVLVNIDIYYAQHISKKGRSLQKINIFTYFHDLLTPCGLPSPLASFLMASAERRGEWVIQSDDIKAVAQKQRI